MIWPANIDARKIPLKHAVPAPTLGEIKDAAAAPGLNPETEQEEAYPGEWWKRGGVAIVDRKGPKTLILREIAGKTRKNKE